MKHGGILTIATHFNWLETVTQSLVHFQTLFVFEENETILDSYMITKLKYSTW
jgi:hypothetical protein